MDMAYYPGCTLRASSSIYDVQIRQVLKEIGINLQEIEDWNCCGATEYFTLNPLPAYTLVARNLALVPKEKSDLVAPCSACYFNLYKTDHNMAWYPQLNSDINTALAEGQLSYTPGRVKVRHALDLLVNDAGCEQIAAHVKRPLRGLRLAPYYGCLIVRPDHGFDDPEYPQTLDRLLAALGATVVDYPLKAACCGGHIPQINVETALVLIHELMATAVKGGADAIVTICPMCQLNLDAYQSQANSQYGTSYSMPVLYFTQLMGLAFGLSPEALGFGQELVSAQPLLAKLDSPPAAEAETKKQQRNKKEMPMPRMP